MQKPPELVVARHTEFTAAQDVSGRQIHQPVVVRPLELLQEPRVVVQDERARIRHAEAVDGIAQVDSFGHLLGMRPGDLGEAVLGDELIIGGRTERVAVGNERMHPVDDRELLGQRVRDTEVVRLPSRGSR